MKRYSFSLLFVLSLALVLLTLSPSLAGATIQTIDSTENSGYANQMVLTSTGKPVIAYRNIQNVSTPEIRLAICNDAACSSPTLRSIKTGVSSASGGMAITADDRPVISNSGFEGIQLQVCDDASCATHTQVVVDAASQGHSTVQINSSGQPVVAYRKLGTNVLMIAICNNLACASPTIRTTTEISTTDNLKMVLVNDKPVIAYLTANSDASLKLMACNDTTCSSTTINTVDSSGQVSGRFDLAVNSSGFPFVTYWHQTNLDLMLARCSTTTCTAGSVTTSIADGDKGFFGGFASSIKINASGNPVIAYTMNTAGIWLKLMRCNDPQCNSTTNPPDITFVDWSPTKAFYSGESPSLALANELPVIAFGRDYDTTNVNQLDLMLATCNDARCYDPGFTSTPASGSTVKLQGAVGAVVKSCIIVGNRGEDGSGLNIMVDSLSAGYSITFPTSLPIVGMLEPNIGLNGATQYSNDACLQVACTIPQDPGTLTVRTNEDGSPTYNYNLECTELLPTATPTSTNTDVPAATSTPTSTNTPIPPTATNTSVPGTATSTLAVSATPTSTSQPATATSTSTSVPATATPTATDLPGAQLIVNGGMETDDNNDKIPDNWALAKASSDVQKCNKPDKPVAFNGECAFQFKGGAGEQAKLQQKPNLSGLTFEVGGTLTLQLYVKSPSSATKGSIKLIVKYSDGTITPSKVKLNFAPVDDYTELIGSTPISSAGVASIKVMLKNQSTGGKTFVDDVKVLLTTAQGGLLTLP